MDFIELNPHAKELIFLTPVLAIKMELNIQRTMRNAPYVHPRLDSILELCRTFSIDPTAVIFSLTVLFTAFLAMESNTVSSL